MGIKKEDLDSDSSLCNLVSAFTTISTHTRSEIRMDTTGTYHYDQDDDPSLRFSEVIKKTPTEKRACVEL